nr:hypothetical protein [Tanacetum cinerariifolium]
MGNHPAGSTLAYHPQGGFIPQAFTNNSVPSYNGPMHPNVTPSSNYPFYTPPNMLEYPNPLRPFADFAEYEGKEIIFRPIARANNAPVIIEAKIFERKVRRVHMDSGSSCEIIYKSCFEKLNPTIKATKVDLKTPLVGFSRQRSWSIGEVSLEITIGDAPFLRTKTLNFVIVRYDSPYNMLLGITAMQMIGMVVSTIHEAIKFNTKKGIETV